MLLVGSILCKRRGCAHFRDSPPNFGRAACSAVFFLLERKSPEMVSEPRVVGGSVSKGLLQDVHAR